MHIQVKISTEAFYDTTMTMIRALIDGRKTLSYEVSVGFNGVKTFDIVIETGDTETRDFLNAISGSNRGDVKIYRNIPNSELHSSIQMEAEIAKTLRNEREMVITNLVAEGAEKGLKTYAKSIPIGYRSDEEIDDMTSTGVINYVNEIHPIQELIYKYLKDTDQELTVENMRTAYAKSVTELQSNIQRRRVQSG